MELIKKIEFYKGSQEELLPGFSPEFPYISSLARTNLDQGGFVPWHWHSAVEIFYMQKGTLEYRVPGQSFQFPEGTAGFINSNVLHSTQIISPAPLRSHSSDSFDTMDSFSPLLHIFDPSFIGNGQESRIQSELVEPVISRDAPEILSFSPAEPDHNNIIRLIRDGFFISREEPGYEIRIRNQMSEIWLELYRFIVLENKPQSRKHNGVSSSSNEALKGMLSFLYAHYPEKITSADLAAAGSISERECYRIFRFLLKTTPSAYLQNYRLQAACRLLKTTDFPITTIALSCGFGSSSYFGSIFRRELQCTPVEYRKLALRNGPRR